MKSCPWCGNTLSSDTLDRCERCKWTREKSNSRPAMIAYSIFILVAIVLGIATFKYVRNMTKDVDVKALGAFIILQNQSPDQKWK